MADGISSFLSIFTKLPSSWLVSFLIVIGIVLFSPSELANTLAVEEMREKYRIFLGPLFLVILFFLIANLFSLGWAKFLQVTRLKKKIRAAKENLEKLTSEEKGYLAVYIVDAKNTVYVGLEDGIISGLVGKGIVYRASNHFDLLNGCAFNLQPWAREHLEGNVGILEGAEGRPLTPRERMRQGGW